MTKYLLILTLIFCVSCGSHNQKSSLRKHLSQISYSPPKQIHYTKTVPVYFFKKKISWKKIPISRIKTRILTKTSRLAGIGIPLEIQAAENKKKIFFKIQWHDSHPHINSNWTKAEKLAFNWNVHSFSFSNKGCDAACHFVPPSINPRAVQGMWLPRKSEIAENWLWIANPGPNGRIQDRNLTGAPVLKKIGGHFIKSGFTPDITPLILKAKAGYHQDKWMVLISRPLLTPNPKETQFHSRNLMKSFGISVFRGTAYHDYSGILTLRAR